MNTENQYKKSSKWINKPLTIRVLIAMILADVDIFLLKEPDQVTDLTRTYTVEEVRAQLQKTGYKVVKVLMEVDLAIDEPIQHNWTMRARNQLVDDFLRGYFEDEYLNLCH